MSHTKNEIFHLLDTVQGTGAFAVSGIKNFITPGLSINKLGELGFPLSPILIKAMIDIAQKAPFGKGSETILDTNVRSAWEIDGDQISFLNEEWKAIFEEIIAHVKKGLGIENHAVEAHLYKLLIYEAGDFFLPHKDSEKEKGMFGTLVIGLPSKHEGGEMHLRFEGEEEVADFSYAASNYKIPYVAFYADCEHEIKPVTSGYRVCLVYNLVQKSGGNAPTAPEFNSQTQQITQLLKKWAPTFDNKPIAILLGHQYTPSNFSQEALKLNDAPRANVLLQAAENAGYFARLGLVTNYISGELEDDGSYYNNYRRRGRYYDYEEEEEESSDTGTMGEIYDEYTEIQHWAEDNLPALGNLMIDKSNILSDFELAEDDPIEQQQEGYTGNAGMEIEYWYHYGAVILWPKSQHADMVNYLAQSVQLDWIRFYVTHWENPDAAAPIFTKLLVKNFQHYSADKESYRRNTTDFSPLADGLSKLADEGLFIKFSQPLTEAFSNIKEPAWQGLLEIFDNPLAEPIFKKAGLSGDKITLNQLLLNLSHLYIVGNEKLQAFVEQQIPEIPAYLHKAHLGKEEKRSYYYYDEDTTVEPDLTVQSIIEGALFFSKINKKEQLEEWVTATTEAITHDASRDFINFQLIPVLLKNDIPTTNLKKSLLNFCVNDLKKRTKVEPTPFATWTREVPESTHYEEVWKRLATFLQSPTMKTYDYVANEKLRNVVESAIKNVEIDLEGITIRKGRPYTLRLTKTQAAFEKQHRKWTEDMELLERVDKE